MSIASSTSGFSGYSDVGDSESNEVSLSSHSEKEENVRSPCSTNDRCNGSKRCGKVNMKSRSMKFVIVGLVFGFAALVIILSFLVTTFLVFNHSRKAVSQNKFESFDLFYWNKETNETAFGRVVLPSELGPSTFTTYSTKNGGEGIISKLGTEIYDCSGSCFCDTERRSSATVVKTTVRYILAAFTSAFALHLAKSHFKKQCKEDLENSCPSIYVKSEVDSCDKIKGESSGDIDVEGGVNKKGLNKFSCTGKCMGGNAFLNGVEIVPCNALKALTTVVYAWNPPWTKEDVEVRFQSGALHLACVAFECEGYSGKKSPYEKNNQSVKCMME